MMVIRTTRDGDGGNSAYSIDISIIPITRASILIGEELLRRSRLLNMAHYIYTYYFIFTLYHIYINVCARNLTYT